MKQTMIIGVAAFMALAVNAATVEVIGSYTLVNGNAYHPVISADGSKVIFSPEDYSGLNLIDFNRREVVEISKERGSGFAAQFSPDGEAVLYRCEGNIGRLRAKNVMSYDVSTDKTTEIAPMNREEKSLDAYLEGNRVNVHSDYREIVVTIDGVTSRINPVEGAQSYIWVKLSPDKKRVLFVEPFKGAFVCNIDGKELKSLGKGTFPSWLGNEFVLLTLSEDNGDVITRSQVVAVEVSTGKVTEITSADSMTEEATGSIAAGKIVCSGAGGKLIVAEIKITE